jgi:hypothetical protein
MEFETKRRRACAGATAGPVRNKAAGKDNKDRSGE